MAVGQLRNPGAVALLASCVDRLQPLGFWDLEDRGADRLGELVADREADCGVALGGSERVRRAADIGADEGLAVNVPAGNCSNASSSGVKRSTAVFDPAFPGRRIAASASPVSSR